MNKAGVFVLICLPVFAYSILVKPNCPFNKVASKKSIRGKTVGFFQEFLQDEVPNNDGCGSIQSEDIPQDDDGEDDDENYDENLTEKDKMKLDNRLFFNWFNQNRPNAPSYPNPPNRPPNFPNRPDSSNYPNRPTYPPNNENYPNRPTTFRPDGYPTRPTYYPDYSQPTRPTYPVRPTYPPTRPTRPTARPPYWSGGVFAQDNYPHRPPNPDYPSNNVKPVQEVNEDSTSPNWRPNGPVGGLPNYVIGHPPYRPNPRPPTQPRPPNRPRQYSRSIVSSFVDLFLK